jgi:cell division transport system permease protein
MSFFGIRRVAAARAMRVARTRPSMVLLATALSASVLCLCLALGSAAALISPLAARVSLAPEVSVFVSLAATAQDVKTLQGRIEQMPGVAEVRFVPRDAALADLARRSGIGSPLGELKGNPLPDVLVVALARGTPAARVDETVAALRKLPRVDSAQADGAWYQRLVTLARIAQVGGAVLAAVLVVLLAVVLVGAVRLLASASNDEIRVLRVVGADDSFIARPFAYLAAATLAAGAVIAVLVVAGALRLLAPEIDALAQAYGPITPVIPATWPAGVAFVVAAALFGWLLGYLGVRAAIRLHR